jgi:hypothetical protein
VQITNIAPCLEYAKNRALHVRCSAAEQRKSLVCVDGKDYMIECATSFIREFDRGSIVELSNTFNCCAQM